MASEVYNFNNVHQLNFINKKIILRKSIIMVEKGLTTVNYFFKASQLNKEIKILFHINHWILLISGSSRSQSVECQNRRYFRNKVLK